MAALEQRSCLGAAGFRLRYQGGQLVDVRFSFPHLFTRPHVFCTSTGIATSTSSMSVSCGVNDELDRYDCVSWMGRIERHAAQEEDREGAVSRGVQL